MAFNIQEFLVSRAVGETVNSDNETVTRIALLTSMMNLPILQSAVLSRVLAQSQAPPPPVVDNRARALSRRVKIPDLKHHTAAKQVHEHLGEHKLRARIHAEPAADLKTPRVIFQWPQPDMEADPDSEVHVVMLTPPEEAEVPRRR